MKLTGKQIINGTFVARGTDTFNSLNATLNTPLETAFTEATDEELSNAADIALEAFKIYRNVSHSQRAAFLRNIAAEIEGLGDELIEIGSIETALTHDRLKGERSRTINQLNAFANFIENPDWVRPIIDKADADRKPLPKPDLRQMQIPIGPVGVFGASNFPFAFSVAGGDTASALAAGCPVIFKAHPAHPSTCEMVGTAILRAIEKSKVPPGVFALVHGRSTRVGSTLVMQSNLKAIAFTGSFKGGKALHDLAVRRNEPIPVYAEMGSVNPVIILSGVVKEKGEITAKQLAGSITLGAGQFCTNPGVIVMKDEPQTATFLDKLTEELNAVQPMTMLTPTISKSYLKGIKQQRSIAGITPLLVDPKDRIMPHLIKIKAEDALKNTEVLEEVFGPSSVAVISNNMEDLISFCSRMGGQLTATLIGNEEDLKNVGELIQVLTQKVGRLVINGYPTGVEVSPAMVHGGPYPATTDSRSTSVGLTAIYRFTRPFCFQNFPTFLLPEDLRK
ncbi:MAG TPA: aldehyde dehydrogenase (NADP(+)) [Chryseolinea sp.]|nr:aldehyde dehydrogenase (NADP(+)) [Chryseolinea sp.]